MLLICQPCQQQYQVPDHAAGPVPCPKCRRTLQAHLPSPPVSVLAEPAPEPAEKTAARNAWGLALVWILLAAAWFFLLAPILIADSSPSSPLWFLVHIALAATVATAIERIAG